MKKKYVWLALLALAAPLMAEVFSGCVSLIG